MTDVKSAGRVVRTLAVLEAIETRRLLTGGTAAAVGYLPDYEYGTIATPLANAKYEGLTQVNYFSVVPTATGLLPGTAVGSASNTGTSTTSGYFLTGNTSQLAKLVTSAHAAGVKVDVVIGGGGSQSNTLASLVAAGGGSTAFSNFAASVTQFVSAHNIDGIDIDFEPASLGANDVSNYGKLIAAVRAANPSISISAAVNAERLQVATGGTAYVLNATAIQNLTSINVMAYDLEAGNTSPIGHAETDLAGWGNYMTSLGAPKSELVFGMPFYGTSGTSWANTIAEKYSDLVAGNGSLPSPSASSVVINGVTWNYNGPTTIAAKTTYALANGYGGVTAWEVGQDYLSAGTYDNTYSLLPQFKQAVTAGTGSIGGTVTTAGGTALAGATVFLDTNGNGMLDAGELSATTSAAGTYAFSGLRIGTYAVRQVVPAGYTQITPGTGAVSAVVTAGQAAAAGFVDKAPLTNTALQLSTAGSTTSDATQALAFTAAVTGGVPDGETVLLEDASNGNAVVATGTFTGGSAAFTVPAGALPAGAHNLFAVYSGDASFAASTSATVTQTVQVVVTGVVINGDLPGLVGAQRSMVDDVVYTFSEPVNVAGANAFTVAVSTGQPGTVPTLGWTALAPAADGSSTQWAVTFAGAGVVGHSIGNGLYQISLNPAAATADSNPQVAAQGRTADQFYREFGDIDGNRAVSFSDFLVLQSVFGTTSASPNFIAGLDADGNGAITFSDFLALQGNFAAKAPLVAVNQVVLAKKVAAPAAQPAVKLTAAAVKKTAKVG